MLKSTQLFTVLKNKDFLRIWSAQVISLTTAHLLNFVLINKIFTATKSTVAIGLFFGFYYLPTILLGPFTGVLVDRWDKKKILILSNFLQAGVVLFYLGLGGRIWPIFAIVLLYSLCDEFFNPAVGACLPAVVAKKALPAANGFFLLTTQGALAFGFMMGGLLLRWLRPEFLIFWLACLLLLLASLAAVGFSQKVSKKTQRAKFNREEFLRQFSEGYQFIKNEPLVFFPIMLLAILQVFLGVIVILLPSVSEQILKIPFRDSSLVLIVPAILGAALGSFLVERLIVNYRKKDLITAGLFTTGFLIGLFNLILPQLEIPWVWGLSLAVGLGLCFALMFVPSQTLVQENTPFGVRGRVFAALSSLVNLAGAVPMLITAGLVDFFGVRLVLFGVALGVIGLGFYALRGKYGLLGVNHRA